MIEEFRILREDEAELMFKAPLYVGILIAGADGVIDNAERREIMDTVEMKKNKSREILTKYYKEVSVDFEKKFNEMIEELPSETQERNQMIAAELRRVSYILPKINSRFAVELYNSLKDLAKKTAQASGGVLGFLSISYEEAQLVSLKMIAEPELDQ